MKIYFAGPLFTTGERWFNMEVSSRLEAAGHEVFLPQERPFDDGTMPPRTGPEAEAARRATEGTARARTYSPGEILLKNKRDLDAAEVVVAVMDGPDPDSGTAWECGYAYALGKPQVLFRTDFRGGGDVVRSPYNAMLTGSADAHLELPLASVDEAASAILRALEDLARGSA